MNKLFFTGVFLLGIKITITSQLFCENFPAIQSGGALQSNNILDAIIIYVGMAIVLVTFILSIKYLLKPNESDPNHIKNIIKNEGF